MSMGITVTLLDETAAKLLMVKGGRSQVIQEALTEWFEKHPERLVPGFPCQPAEVKPQGKVPL